MNRVKNKSTKVLALFCALSFLMYVDRVSLSASAALIKEEIVLDNTELGLIFSAFAYTYLIFQIIGGWFCDRFGAKRTIIICGSIWVIATTVAATRQRSNMVKRQSKAAFIFWKR